MHIDKLCLSDFICAEISDYHPNGHFESNDKICLNCFLLAKQFLHSNCVENKLKNVCW